jgi:DNA-binding MarR family transcriptional regulator
VPEARDASPPDLPIHHMPGHYIRRLQQVAVALFARELDGTGITPVQYASLAALQRVQACDQAELALLIGYDRATIGGVIDRLEAKGWLTRAPSATDRRRKLVALSAAGSVVLRRVTPAVRGVQALLLAPLSPAERRRFERLCRKLLIAHVG